MEAKTPNLMPKRLSQTYTVTIRETRRRNKNEKAVGLIICVLSITGFLLALSSMKCIWDFKIENWHLCKENAVLKKTVRDNVAEEKFQNNFQSEEEILEFEHPGFSDRPSKSWGVSFQIFWSSSFVTSYDMRLLRRELSNQIYQKKSEALFMSDAGLNATAPQVCYGKGYRCDAGRDHQCCYCKCLDPPGCNHSTALFCWADRGPYAQYCCSKHGQPACCNR
jgi:hypothetical protein